MTWIDIIKKTSDDLCIKERDARRIVFEIRRKNPSVKASAILSWQACFVGEKVNVNWCVFQPVEKSDTLDYTGTKNGPIEDVRKVKSIGDVATKRISTKDGIVYKMSFLGLKVTGQPSLLSHIAFNNALHALKEMLQQKAIRTDDGWKLLDESIIKTNKQ